MKSTTIHDHDPLHTYHEEAVGLEGMRVDRDLFERFSEPIRRDPDIENAVRQEQWETAVRILRQRYENKPEDFGKEVKNGNIA